MDKNKTLVLTILALLAYALFVYHGMTFDPMLDRPVSSAVNLSDVVQVPQLPRVSDSTAPGGDTASATTSPGGTKVAGHTFQFSKISFEITSVYKHKERGKTYLVYEFNWTNTSNEPIDFTDGNICLETYQNGIQCDKYVVSMDIDLNCMTKIQPGRSLVSRDIVLLSDDSNVETHISEYFKNTEPIVFTTNLSKIKTK